jgi:hypothetical protein
MFESCHWLCFTPLFPQIRPLSFLQLELHERREPREQQNQVPTATDFTKSTPKSKLSHRAIRVIHVYIISRLFSPQISSLHNVSKNMPLSSTLSLQFLSLTSTRTRTFEDISHIANSYCMNTYCILHRHQVLKIVSTS